MNNNIIFNGENDVWHTYKKTTKKQATNWWIIASFTSIGLKESRAWKRGETSNTHDICQAYKMSKYTGTDKKVKLIYRVVQNKLDTF